MEDFIRTHHCGELRLSNVGEKVTIIGWVSKRRNLGSLSFLISGTLISSVFTKTWTIP